MFKKMLKSLASISSRSFFSRDQLWHYKPGLGNPLDQERDTSHSSLGLFLSLELDLSE